MDTQEIVSLTAQVIYDKKGMNILALDVRGVSTMTDFFIIAEGTVDRHVIALGRAIEEALSEQRLDPLHMEGTREGEWVVLDYGDLVVHLFTPELRERYELEKLWKEGTVIDVALKTRSLSEGAGL